MELNKLSSSELFQLYEDKLKDEEYRGTQEGKLQSFKEELEEVDITIYDNNWGCGLNALNKVENIFKKYAEYSKTFSQKDFKLVLEENFDIVNEEYIKKKIISVVERNSIRKILSILKESCLSCEDSGLFKVEEWSPFRFAPIENWHVSAGISKMKGLL